MGNSAGKAANDEAVIRAKAITGGGIAAKKNTLPKLPSNAVKTNPDDFAFIEVSPNWWLGTFAAYDKHPCCTHTYRKHCPSYFCSTRQMAPSKGGWWRKCGSAQWQRVKS